MKVQDYRNKLQHFITKLPMTDAEIMKFVTFLNDVTAWFESKESSATVSISEVVIAQEILRRIKLHCAKRTIEVMRGVPLTGDYKALQAQLLDDYFEMLETVGQDVVW